MAASAQQCCTSFSTSWSGNWQYASNHQSPFKWACVCWCLWASTSTYCISMPNMVRRDICRHNYAVERRLFVVFCGQPHYCYRPYYPTARFRSLVIHGLWWTVYGQAKAHVVLTCTNGILPSHLPLATKCEPYCRHVPINKNWRRTESTPRSGWQCSHVAGIYSDFSTREIISAPFLYVKSCEYCIVYICGHCSWLLVNNPECGRHMLMTSMWKNSERNRHTLLLIWQNCILMLWAYKGNIQLTHYWWQFVSCVINWDDRKQHFCCVHWFLVICHYLFFLSV